MFSVLYEIKFGIFLKMSFLALLEIKGFNESTHKKKNNNLNV